jgi:hypothetical protein
MRCWKRQYRCALTLWTAISLAHAQNTRFGREVAIPEHLQNGQEAQIWLTTLLDFGKQLFTANWTIQEGKATRSKGKATRSKGKATRSLIVDEDNRRLAR